MSYELVKANLNLYAVLKNLEDLIKYDDEMNNLAKDWKISIQFSVKGGPQAYIDFKDGQCFVGRGKIKSPSVILYFLSPAHLNKMMDGNGNPIPLKGFTKLGFLTGDFDKVTKRLEYYLKPTDELLKEQKYLQLNTRFTLNTAAYAIREIGLLDDFGKITASHIRDGIVEMKINPDGPSVFVEFKNGDIIPGTGKAENVMSSLSFKDIQVASDFLNGKTDAFTAIASGDVMMKGQIPMAEGVSLILDRIPEYLE